MDNSQLKDSRSNTPDYDFIVHTFGCKVNTYDTGLIQKNLRTNGFNEKKDLKSKTPVHVLNTCAVTAEATQQAVRLIRKIKAQDPLATVVVTGCAAQVDTGAFENLKSADLIVANSHKGLLPQIIDQYFKRENTQRIFKSNIFRKDDLEAGGGEESLHTRSFLKIQDGCNSFCSFCIIPYARGKSRSVPIRDLVKKIKELEERGLKEVVLTGVHIGDYEDLQSKKGLDDLVEAVLQQTQIPRLRLSSLEPIEISERMLEMFSDKRLCPHFHMSIQSADSEVLKQMKRNYEQKDVRVILQKISDKVPSVYVGMDVIAGFPTETDEQFENTYKTLAESPWTRLHVFPYSERQGTRAATMPQLSLMQRKERAQRLRELSLHRLQSEALKQIGQVKETLILNKLGQQSQSMSRDYWNIHLGLNEELHAQIKNSEVLCRITAVDILDTDVVLKGELLNNG